MMVKLLERVACTTQGPLRKAALKALRARSRASFENLMDVLLGDGSENEPGLVLDAALYSKRPIVPEVLRSLKGPTRPALDGQDRSCFGCCMLETAPGGVTSGNRWPCD